MNLNELIVFVAHMDDLEFSCLGFLLKNEKKYNLIKIVTASTWQEKEKTFKRNLEDIGCALGTKLEFINLDFHQRNLQSNFDDLKNKFYEQIDFDKNFDILTHDKNDAHSDHTAVHNISYGLFKYTKRFVTFYSPSSVNFVPNYYIELSKKNYDWKHKLLTNYDFTKEQSYSKKGTYFRKDYTNVASIYSMENFVGNEMKYCEIYKIYKWID